MGVSEAAHAAAIGIDAEPNQPVPGPLLHWVATPDERAEVDALLRASPGVRFDRLLLCAKEAVFKSWFTLTTRRLGFEDVAIELEPAPGSGTFTARLEDAHDRRARLRGRWLLAEGLLITAVVIAVEPSPPSAERLSSRALRH
nr:4'-phosphopantetheinyl transferase superfamily protein [Blastococcus sp. TF02-8]